MGIGDWEYLEAECEIRSREDCRRDAEDVCLHFLPEVRQSGKSAFLIQESTKEQRPPERAVK